MAKVLVVGADRGGLELVALRGTHHASLGQPLPLAPRLADGEGRTDLRAAVASKRDERVAMPLFRLGQRPRRVPDSLAPLAVPDPRAELRLAVAAAALRLAARPGVPFLDALRHLRPPRAGRQGYAAR